MSAENNLFLSTSPQTQPTGKPRSFASLAFQRRSLCGRTLRCNAVKELDAETGLYYYGARYLDPKTSRWLSGDPAVSEYIPQAPVSEEAKKRNGSLPGMGGVFNYANLHVYHYAGNNPVKYTDPDGRDYNDDGTYTVEDGDTLWGIYGADWQEKSGYTGDPTKLQVGEVVGQKKVESKTNTTHVTASGSGVGVFVAGIPLSDKQLDISLYTMYFTVNETGEVFKQKFSTVTPIGIGLKFSGGVYVVTFYANGVFRGEIPTREDIIKSFEGEAQSMGFSLFYFGAGGIDANNWTIQYGTFGASVGVPFSIVGERSLTRRR